VVPTVRIKDVAAHLNVSHQRGTQPAKIERWAQARVVGDAALEAAALTVPAGTTTLTLCQYLPVPVPSTRERQAFAAPTRGAIVAE
jgi:hypothetical protein